MPFSIHACLCSSHIIEWNDRFYVSLPPATPVASPSALGVEHLKPSRLQGEDVGRRRRLARDDCVPVVHVVHPLREELPQEAPSTTPSSLRRVEHGLVDRIDEYVPKRLVEVAILCRDPKFTKHNGHAEHVVCIVDVALHPCLHKLAIGYGDRVW